MKERNGNLLFLLTSHWYYDTSLELATIHYISSWPGSPLLFSITAAALYGSCVSDLGCLNSTALGQAILDIPGPLLAAPIMVPGIRSQFCCYCITSVTCHDGCIILVQCLLASAVCVHSDNIIVLFAPVCNLPDRRAHDWCQMWGNPAYLYS